jgi:hypothetical protein
MNGLPVFGFGGHTTTAERVRNVYTQIEGFENRRLPPLPPQAVVAGQFRPSPSDPAAAQPDQIVAL